MGMERTVYRSLDETLYSFRHPSGLRVRFVPKKGYARKFAVLAVDFGSVNTRFRAPGEKNITEVPQGIAHFLEHKLFEQENGNVLGQYAALGASPNAATGFSQTYYYFTCTDRFEECLRLLLHFVTHPYLTDENVEKEKGIIEQEIRMYDDDPYYKGMIQLFRLIYHRNPVRNDIAGSVADIRALTKETLMQCYRAFYRPENMCLTVVGDLEAERVRELVSETEIPEGRPGALVRQYEDEPSSIAGRYAECEMDVALPLFHFGFKDRNTDFEGISRIRRDFAGTIAKDLLFGRQTPFYEEMLASGKINPEFNASYEIEREYALAMVTGESEEPDAVRETVEKYLRKTARKGFSRTDFETVRSATEGRMLKRLNTPESLGTLIGISALQGVNAFDYFTACGKITFEEVTGFFREVFLGDMAVSLVTGRKGR